MMKARAGIIFLCIVMAGTDVIRGAEADDGWSFKINPYVWTPGLSGDISLGNLPAVSVDMGSQSILDMVDAGFAGSFEVRKGDVFVMTDVLYTELSDSQRILLNRVDVDITSAHAGIAVGYRVNKETPVDIYVGGRYHYFDAGVSTYGLVTASASSSSEKFEPLAGARVSIPVAKWLSLDLSATLAGFGIDSTVVWELWPAVCFRFSDYFAGIVGYRYQNISLEKNNFNIDVELRGLVLGLGVTL